MDKRLFVPLTGSKAKRMRARPVFKVGDWLYVVRSAFAECPNANHFYSELGCLFKCLGHARTIFVAIHHCDVRSSETKRPAVDFETRSASADKLAGRRRSGCFRGRRPKENRRAHDYE